MLNFKVILMKLKFKTLAFALTGMLFTNAAFSQVQWGVRAGVNFSNLNGKIASISTDGKLLTGFNAGVTADINLADEFFIQPGLLYTTKGSKAKNVDASTTLNYIELPVNFLYKPELGTGNLLLGVGPYAAYGVGGKAKLGNAETDVKFGKDEVYKAMDFGGNLLFGYQLANGLSAQLNAQLGMGNILNNGDSNNKLNNTVFGVSLGYKF